MVLHEGDIVAGCFFGCTGGVAVWMLVSKVMMAVVLALMAVVTAMLLAMVPGAFTPARSLKTWEAVQRVSTRLAAALLGTPGVRRRRTTSFPPTVVRVEAHLHQLMMGA